MKSKYKLIFTRILLFLIMAALMTFVLFPLIWVLSTALKSKTEVFASPPYIIPHSVTFDNFLSIWKDRNFGAYFVNSMIVAAVTTVLCLVIANLAAFGFSRYRMKHANKLIMFILVSQMVPSVLFVMPYFVMMSRAGLVDSKIALIIAHTSFSLPFCTWMLRGYYDSIPFSIDEAGRLDGCSRLSVLTKIVFPLSIPGNIATLIFSFMQSWNEYLFSMSLTTTDRMYTIPVGIAMFMGEYQTEWNELMAASLAASIPVIIVYLIADKYLIGGLTAGAIRQ